MINKPKNGFVLGKFMPLHKGHEFLCRFGAEYCENLTILVCSLPTEPIKGNLRFEWMKELFPNSRVLHCKEVLPQVPEHHPDFWKIWNDVITRYHPEPLDVIFASESYGDTLAKNYGCQFVPCDLGRVAYDISGTRVRFDPYVNWDYLTSPVKRHYRTRVCMAGVESTGKTTLANDLVKFLVGNAIYLPEYGRTYTEFFGTDVKPTDIANIVKGHQASRKALERTCDEMIVIEDTDPIMSACWSDMLCGERDPWFDDFKDYADLYILCDIDIPWVDDGTRYFSNDEDRRRFHEKIENELIARKVNYIKVSGTQVSRMYKANHRIDEFMDKKTEPSPVLLSDVFDYDPKDFQKFIEEGQHLV